MSPDNLLRHRLTLTGEYDSIEEAVSDILHQVDEFLHHYNISPDHLKMAKLPITRAVKVGGKYRVSISWAYWYTERLHWPPLTSQNS